MPKPKQKKAEPVFLAHSFPLSKKARSQLVDLLGFAPEDPLEATTPVGKALLEVEAALGLYVYGSVHFDEIPRPADYVNTFKPIEATTKELLKLLWGLGGYFSEQFTLKGADQDAIEAALVELLRVSGAVVEDFKALPSKGAKKNNALAEVVRRLRRIFRNYYRGPVVGRRKSGAFVYRAEEERREIEFVRVALLDARIITKGYSGLKHLFLDPRCALPVERSNTVERIASKVDVVQ